MTPVTVGVTFRKQVSDGNYGTESAEVHISADLGTEDSYDGACSLLLTQARAMVIAELGGSPSIAVRRALQQQEPRGPVSRAERGADDMPF